MNKQWMAAVSIVSALAIGAPWVAQAKGRQPDSDTRSDSGASAGTSDTKSGTHGISDTPGLNGTGTDNSGSTGTGTGTSRSDASDNQGTGGAGNGGGSMGGNAGSFGGGSGR